MRALAVVTTRRLLGLLLALSLTLLLALALQVSFFRSQLLALTVAMAAVVAAAVVVVPIITRTIETSALHKALESIARELMVHARIYSNCVTRYWNEGQSVSRG